MCVVVLLCSMGLVLHFDHLFVEEELDCFTFRWFVTHGVQSNLNSSNTDGPFTMANSSLFLSP